MIAVIILSVLLLLSLGANVVQGRVLFKGAQRLLEFDELFEMFYHEIEINVDYFDKLIKTPLLSNAPEIIAAQRNMKVMQLRLEEYVRRMEEELGRALKKEKPKIQRPIVVG